MPIVMVKFVQVLYAMGHSSPYKEVKGMPMEKVIHSGVCTFYISVCCSNVSFFSFVHSSIGDLWVSMLMALTESLKHILNSSG